MTFSRPRDQRSKSSMDLAQATAPELLKEFESKFSEILTIVEHEHELQSHGVKGHGQRATAM